MWIYTDVTAVSKQITIEPIEILKIQVRPTTAAAATATFCQIWDTQYGPSDPSATLKKVFPIVGGGGSGQPVEFTENYNPGDDELELRLGLFVGISSTESTYTAVTAGNGYALLYVEGRRQEQPLSAGVTTTGDMSSNVTGLQVWSESSGASTKQKLLQVEVDTTNLTGTAKQWLMIFGKDTVNTGDLPQSSPITLTPGSAGKLIGLFAKRFGTYGRGVGVNDNGTYRYGCTLKISSTAPGFTAPNGTVLLRAQSINAP